MNYLDIWNKKAPCKLNADNSKTKLLKNTVGCQAITHTVVINGKEGTITVGCKAFFYQQMHAGQKKDAELKQVNGTCINYL